MKVMKMLFKKAKILAIENFWNIASLISFIIVDEKLHNDISETGEDWAFKLLINVILCSKIDGYFVLHLKIITLISSNSFTGFSF